MSLVRPTILLTARALVQFPRIPSVLVFSMVPPLIQLLLFGSIFNSLTNLPGFPTDNYYEYLAPAVVLFTTVVGVANAGVALVTDFQNRYFQKILVAPVNIYAILLGRLFADGIRVYLQAGLILVISLFFGARVATGVPGALLILLLATLFSLFTVGIFVANVGLRTKSSQAVQAVFPLFFILMFLTTAFMTEDNIESEVVRTLISFNPAEYVVRPLHTLMLSGYDWGEIGIALGMTAGFAVVGIVLTRINFRSVYK